MVSTNNQGEAVVKIRSKAAGKGSLIATMENGNYLKKNIQFIADKSTATLTVFNVIQANSTIKVDKSSYIAGQDILVTVILKGAQGNEVTGKNLELTPTTVKVPNAAVKNYLIWEEKEDGTYTITYVANTVGTDLKATLSLTGWTDKVQSVSYDIIAGTAVQANSAIIRGDYPSDYMNAYGYYPDDHHGRG